MMARAGRASTVGMEFAIAVIGCLLLGWWLDGKFGTDPVLTLIGLGLGTATGFWTLYKAGKALQKQALEDAERQRQEAKKSLDKDDD